MPRSVAALFAAAALSLAACGDTPDGGGTLAAPAQPAASARPADLPSTKGKTLADLTDGMAKGPVFASSVSQLQVGSNRVGFVLFDRARKAIDAAAVAVYTARPDGTQLRGPFVARREALAPKPAYRSEQTDADLQVANSFWVAEVPFRRRGSRVLTALARLDGRLLAASGTEMKVGQRNGPPDVGERAIPIHTLTAADVGGDLTKLSTRVPPPKQLLDTDFADVLGRGPVVLQFVTPALCQTRVCGPVVDIAEQVRAENGDGVTFIQQEIYTDNDVGKGFRSQVAAWHLPTEPWTFVVDRSGRISARFEGAVSAGELARAIEKVK